MNDNELNNMSTEQLAALMERARDKLENKIANEVKIDFPNINTKGMSKATLKNSEALFKAYGITIRHNEMSKISEIDIAGRVFHADTEMNAKMAYLTDLYEQQDLPVRCLTNAISVVANRNTYHPVRDWIDSQAWDGVSRLEEFYSSLEIDEELHIDPALYRKLKNVMMRKWALSGVAALYHSHFSCEGVLCLFGKQAAGKTTWVQSLLDRKHQNEWFKDGVSLDLGNKDSVQKALGTWITELGEIDSTFKRSDIEQLKAFITEKIDVIRPPYERMANRYARRTILLGSMNRQKFLQDDENRRFWPINVSRVRPVTFDAQQFWAEMKQIYLEVAPKIVDAQTREKNNEWGWFLSPIEREELNRIQSVFKSDDPIEEILANNVRLQSDPLTTTLGVYMNCTAVLMACGRANPAKADLNTAGKWLSQQGYKYRKDTRQYQVWIPPRVSYPTENDESIDMSAPKVARYKNKQDY